MKWCPVLTFDLRLSEANLESILKEIEELYRGHSRNGESSFGGNPAR